MIYTKISGRLGNQLFQYATMRAIQEKKSIGKELIMADFSDVYNAGEINEGFENSLKYFNVKGIEVCNKKSIPLNLIYTYYAYRLYSKIIKMINLRKVSNSQYQKIIDDKINTIINKLGGFFYSYGYKSPFEIKNKNSLYIGHFESTKYFDFIKEQLQEEITPKYDELESNRALYNVIRNNNSICVTIRRGDYITNKRWNAKFNICTKEYFEEAIEIMCKKIENPVFIFFSDDIEWVKNNLKYPENSYFESGKDPIWEKLRLMYSCDNFIISNSTFSWWAQYLSKNNEKIVIAPSKWNNDNYYIDGRKIDIYQDDWILIDI